MERLQKVLKVLLFMQRFKVKRRIGYGKRKSIVIQNLFLEDERYRDIFQNGLAIIFNMVIGYGAHETRNSLRMKNCFLDKQLIH
ncbi:hypothetical protein ES708_24481 [subsurface metagenome]